MLLCEFDLSSEGTEKEDLTIAFGSSPTRMNSATRTAREILQIWDELFEQKQTHYVGFLESTVTIETPDRARKMRVAESVLWELGIQKWKTLLEAASQDKVEHIRRLEHSILTARTAE